MKRKRKVVFWGFAIDIVGIQHEGKAQRRKARQLLSRKLLGDIEKAALLATKAKLPPGFSAKLY